MLHNITFAVSLNLCMKVIACVIVCVQVCILACLCVCAPLFICEWVRVWLSYWHGVTTLAQKRAEIKQVEQQALFRSKFCMLVNVSLMNKQSRNKAVLGPQFVLKFVHMENVFLVGKMSRGLSG